MESKILKILITVGIITAIILCLSLITKLLGTLGNFIEDNGLILFVIFWGGVILIGWKRRINNKNNQK